MSQFYPQPDSLLAGRYRVVRTLGRGGMGVVLEAQNTVTQRQVAIKWLLPEFAGSGEASERMMREAAAAARIQHPNVVDVYDVLQDGDAIFLVMELLHGEPLEALLRRGGTPIHELIALLLPAMEGVAEAHRHDIIHRDIHPGNIFLAEEGRERRRVPKVLDFGISKLGGSDQPALTRSNISMGTPLYMSYEQLYSARDVDQRTDVYSFGVILYEALTGTSPFDGDSFVEVAGKITAGTPPDPKALRPDIPTALSQLILWAMARNRDDRIPSMEALIRELEPFASERAFRAQMTDFDAPVPAIRGPLHALDAVAAEDVESLDGPHFADGPATSAPPPLRSASHDGAPIARAGLPLAQARAGSVTSVDADGPVSRPLAQTVHPRVGPARGWRLGAKLALGGMLMVALVAGGMWLAHARRAERAQADAIPAVQPLPLVPAQPPAASATSTGVVAPRPEAKLTPEPAPPTAPQPEPAAPPAKPKTNPYARPDGSIPRWADPANFPRRPAARKTPDPAPSRDPRAGVIRPEDL